MLVITHKRYDCTNHDDKSKQVRICNHSLSPFRKVSERMARNRLTAPLLIVLYCQGAQIWAASDFREIHDLIYGIPELPKFNLGRQLKLIWSTEIPDCKTEKNLFRDLHPVNFTVCDDNSKWCIVTGLKPFWASADLTNPKLAWLSEQSCTVQQGEYFPH